MTTTQGQKELLLSILIVGYTKLKAAILQNELSVEHPDKEAAKQLLNELNEVILPYTLKVAERTGNPELISEIKECVESIPNKFEAQWAEIEGIVNEVKEMVDNAMVIPVPQANQTIL